MGEKVTAIILAGGYSSRMGEFKPLLPIGGRAGVLRLIKNVAESGVQKIVVVTGHNAQELTTAVRRAAPDPGDTKVHCVFNPKYAEGMYTSVCCGITAAQIINSDAVLILPADTPLVSPQSIRKVAFGPYTSKIVIPTYKGKNGHPILIPSAYFDEITDTVDDPPKGGLKALLGRYADDIIKIETYDETVVLDMNTPEEYEDICEWDGGEHINTEPPRIILMRHGSIRQHNEKIFLGQADIPLSNTGREEARKAAEYLAENEDIKRIYTSDLARAAETAEIIGKKIVIAAPEPQSLRNRHAEIPGQARNDKRLSKLIVTLSGLREINLGSWDGRAISEIIAQEPLSYEARGKDIAGFKLPGMENFYDLSYRVQRTMRQILRREKKDPAGGTILIVTHAGPIRTLLAESKDLSIEEALKLPVDKCVPVKYVK
jgi:broad specificity phosphatase PhoE/CTP:molybdopterin cytidylyltransferase MocA